MRINEIFKSIQGEGLFIGLPTVFVRTAGCDLRCKWCDTPYALLDSQGIDWKLEDIENEVSKSGARNVCLTGGDPLRQMEDSVELVRRLAEAGFSVVIETSGAYDISRLPRGVNIAVSMDIKAPGSGMASRNLPGNVDFLRNGDQLKFILTGMEDYEFAKEFLAKHRIPCEVIMTPAGGKELGWLAEKILADGLNVRVLPQLHKYIWGDERGR